MSARTGIPEIYIMNADGSNVIRRTFSGSYSGNPTWSPDGAKIAYTSIVNGNTNMWLVGATSGSPSLLFDEPGHNEMPAWSPDGTTIAFASDRANADVFYDLYTIKPDGTGFAHIPVVNSLGELNYLAPSWSPDGSRLAMEIRQPSGVDALDTRIGVMNADGSGLKAIAAGVKAGTSTSWSADGTRVVYTSLSGSRKDVSWATADGSLRGTLVTNGWNADWQH
jgi:Tol biopolymer transport system component